MKTQTAIDHFKGRDKLAAALGIDRSATHHWGEEVPELRQYQIQVVTKGALKADKRASDRRQAKGSE